jgi:hypothetical protein
MRVRLDNFRAELRVRDLRSIPVYSCYSHPVVPSSPQCCLICVTLSVVSFQYGYDTSVRSPSSTHLELETQLKTYTDRQRIPSHSRIPQSLRSRVTLREIHHPGE